MSYTTSRTVVRNPQAALWALLDKRPHSQGELGYTRYEKGKGLPMAAVDRRSGVYAPRGYAASGVKPV